MKKRNVLSALAISAVLWGTFSVYGDGTKVFVKEAPPVSLESINKEWKEISDPDTLHTFTNGTDVITILKYSKKEDLPAISVADEKYEAVYQTIYSVGKEIYVVTGSAVKAENLSQVREIVESLDYSEPSVSSVPTVTVPAQAADTSSDSNSQSADDTAYETVGNQSQEQEVPYQGWNSIVLYDINQHGITVQRGNDGTGNWYDLYGASYGNLDTLKDETQPIYNSRGEAYYWNGTLAEEAASDAAENEEKKSEVNDPFDLYSWDPGTDSYIPFQMAESSGEPIGKGKGWYYFDESSGNYYPW